MELFTLMLLNDLTPTRFGGLNHLTSSTSDVTFISGDVKEKNVEWWTEDLGRSSSDHVCIFILVSSGAELAERPRRKRVNRRGKKLDWDAYADNVKKMADSWTEAFYSLCDEILDIKARRLDARDASTTTGEVEDAVNRLMTGIVDTARTTLGVRRHQSSSGAQPWMTKEI